MLCAGLDLLDWTAPCGVREYLSKRVDSRGSRFTIHGSRPMKKLLSRMRPGPATWLRGLGPYQREKAPLLIAGYALP